MKRILILNEGTPRVIFVWGNDIPTAGEYISYHGPSNEGITSIPLISEMNQEISFSEDDEILVYEIKTNVSLSIIFYLLY